MVLPGSGFGMTEDPLSVLRRYVAEGKSAVEVVGRDGEVGELVFGHLAFPMDAPCAVKDTSTGGYLSLGMLWLWADAVHVRKLPRSQYMAEARGKGMAMVPIMNERGLKALFGSGDASQVLDVVPPYKSRVVEAGEDVGADRGDETGAGAIGAEAKRERKGEGKRGRVDPEVVAMLEHEVPWHTTESVMCVDHDFGWVLDTMEECVKKDADRGVIRTSRTLRDILEGKGLLSKAERRSRYDEVDRDEYWKLQAGADGAGAGLQTEGGFNTAGRGAAAGGGPQGMPSASGAERMEGVTRTKEESEASRSAKVAERLEKVLEEKLTSSKRVKTERDLVRDKERQAQRDAAARAARNHVKGVPIIVVPSSYAGCLNMLNAASFFQDGNFVPWQERKEAGTKKETRVVVDRSHGRAKPVPYIITDSVARFTSDEWRRVVAVVATGQKWQFKPWPYTSKETGQPDLVELFERHCGFLIHYQDEAPPPEVRLWNAKRIVLSKTVRNHDSIAVREFWETLDRFISTHPKVANYVSY